VRPFVLASGSPARLRLLRAAGFDPVAIVSGVDEEGVAEADPRALVATLAELKAAAVAAREDLPAAAVVLGCDSLLWFDGSVRGKPGSAAAAAAGWREIRGRAGVLLTGHCLIDSATGRRATEVAEAVVRFGEPTDAEIDAYVASGEPLELAGGFAIDGRGSAFVEDIAGHPGTVIGTAMPTVRRLLAELDLRITDLWH
jgi:septum formation protein